MTNTYFNPTPATLEELKSAYKKLAFKYHPDCGGTTEIMQQIIDDLTEYRAALATRYNELATMPYTPHLELTRHRSSYSGITYTVRVFNSNEDGTEAEILRETYPGKERHTAIARYKELLKQRPGIVAEMHIEKSRWER